MAVCVHHDRGRLDGKPVCEHAERPQYRLLFGVEQPIRPLDGSAQRALVRERITTIVAEQVET